MKRTLYFYKYIYREKIFKKRVCDCKYCEILEQFPCKKLYKQYFEFDRVITRRTIHNLNSIIFSHCALNPSHFLEQPSHYLIGYAAMFVDIIQIYIIVVQHESFRISYRWR